MASLSTVHTGKTAGSSILSRGFRSACWFFLGTLIMPAASAFEFSGVKWPGATTDYYVQFTGTSLTGISWQDAFLDALQEWNEETVFNFVPVLEYRDPCNSNNLNSVDFTSTVCGSEFGANTLAVTLTRSSSQILGPPNLIEADIVVNNSVNFNIFDGPIRQFGISGLDFRRISLHELGHVMGLGHEPERAAIMSPNIGDIDRLQSDDIDGVNSLYSGLSACTVKTLSFGTVNEGLDVGDCQVLELTRGGSDTSYIDVYQLQVIDPITLQLTMTSPTLDSVLLLADSQLNYLSFDDKSSGECDSILSSPLDPGTYYVLANTYDVPVRSDCGNTGDYSLTVGYAASVQSTLSGNVSLRGAVSRSAFRGGVTADGGANYGNVFTSTQRLDILAEIDIDLVHQGRAGFLVVAMLSEGQIFLQEGPQGSFQLYNPGAGIPHALNTVLSAQERITIAEELVPAEIGVESISVDFLVGYGLAENPDEVYFHDSPINLTITP